jgi:hypothetical protein
MSNQKIKKTTAKGLLNRKVRGVENMMWAVIGTVLVVVVAFVIWNIFSGAAATINAPQVQIVPQESYIIGKNAEVTLKFGKGLQGVTVKLAVPTGDTITDISGQCTGDQSVSEGQKVTYKCTLNQNPPSGVIYVIVNWAGGSTRVKWVVG